MNKNPAKPRSPFANDKGIALPLVLMLLVVFTLLGTAAYSASQSSLKQATMLRPNLQAKYLARSAVDATIAAWTDKWINSPGAVPTQARFFTRYNDTTDVFDAAFEADVGQDKVIETTQTYNATTGICTITATATANGRTATVSAVSEGLIERQNAQLTHPWYRLCDYWFGPQYVIIPNPDSSEYREDRFGRRYFASYHYADGIVNLSVPGNNVLYLDERETGYTAIGFQAKRIIFNSPLDLYTMGSLLAVIRPQMLVVSAETIDFNNTITIGDSAHGNLTLHLPDGVGISGEKVYHNVSAENQSKVKLDAKYGLISFSNVIMRGSLVGNGQTNDPKQIAGKTFYFRHSDSYNGLNIGTEPNTFSDVANLFGWTLTENDFLLKTLLDKGYLIPPSGISTNSDYDVIFVYQ